MFQLFEIQAILLVNVQIGLIYDPVKSEKITFEKYKTFLIKMLPLGKNPG